MYNIKKHILLLGPFSADIIQTFHAGRTQTLLSKSVVLPHPSMDNNLLVCAGDESTQSVCSLRNENLNLLALHNVRFKINYFFLYCFSMVLTHN
jgi:hypothetical protein